MYSVNKSMAISFLLLLVIKTALANTLECGQCFQNPIYINSKNGTPDSVCWTGGEKQPCSSLELALEGAQLLNSTVVIPVGLVKAVNHPSQSDESHDTKVDNITSCPPQRPWYLYNGTTCKCGDDLGGRVHCDESVDYNLVLNGYCMTNDDMNTTIVGACLYNFFNISNPPYLGNYHILPLNVTLNDGMCGHFNREGTLCGKCKDNYSLPAYSYDLHCIECTYTAYNWAKYVLVAFGPLTLFLFLIFFFRISVTSPPLVAFVLTSQIMSSPLVIRILLVCTEGNVTANTLLRIMTSAYGIWNLDFFRTLLPPICLQLTVFQSLLLDYAIALYPLVLILIIYFVVELQARECRIVVLPLRPIRSCCNHFRRRWNIRKSLIDVFTTFTFLSFVKFLSTSFDILDTGLFYNVYGKMDKHYLYVNPTVTYFGKEHLPYAILAWFVLLVSTEPSISVVSCVSMQVFSKVPHALSTSFLCTSHIHGRLPGLSQ